MARKKIVSAPKTNKTTKTIRSKGYPGEKGRAMMTTKTILDQNSKKEKVDLPKLKMLKRKHSQLLNLL